MSSHSTAQKPLTAQPGNALSGAISVPGDKSISHRALMLGALALGDTVIEGLLESGDVIATAQAMAAFGARLERESDSGNWTVKGLGIGGFQSPQDPIDFGNSGTGARLCAGLIASQPISAHFIGDESLSSRPMGRIIEPLQQFGCQINARKDKYLPMRIIGAKKPAPISYSLPVPSAQVKSAVLLAGLNTPGRTTVIETIASRDHTEKMLAAFGAAIDIEIQNGTRHIHITGEQQLSGQKVMVPGDPSSAAFMLVAALIVTDSEITIKNVLMSETRSGLVTSLLEMGADIQIHNQRVSGGEDIADLTARSSQLKAIEVPASRAPAMIDEYPVLAVAASFAEGVSKMAGLGELRVKESDRLAAIAAGLAANGVAHEAGSDWLHVTGAGGKGVKGGGVVETHLDHRIAMAFLIMGLAAQQPVTVDDGTMIASSFPEFTDLINDIGGDIGGKGDAK